jgi:hypothetical protein
MSFGDIMTTEFWGVPLWGWIVLVVGIVLIVVTVKGAMEKNKEGKDGAKKAEGDVESGDIKLPDGEPKSSSPAAAAEFARDAPLPPPAPSETSQKF